MAKTKQDDRCKACIQAEIDIERLERERDALLACRHGDQRCFECPDTKCCDNLNQEAKDRDDRQSTDSDDQN